jgi:hypothetical protein
MAKKEQSKAYTMNKNDWQKVGKGAGIAVAGSLLAYASITVPTLDFGQSTTVLAPILMILINLGLKWYQGQS